MSLGFDWATFGPFVVILVTLGAALGVSSAVGIDRLPNQLLVWAIINCFLYATGVSGGASFFVSLVPTIVFWARDQKNKRSNSGGELD